MTDRSLSDEAESMEDKQVTLILALGERLKREKAAVEKTLSEIHRATNATTSYTVPTEKVGRAKSKSNGKRARAVDPESLTQRVLAEVTKVCTAGSIARELGEKDERRVYDVLKKAAKGGRIGKGKKPGEFRPSK